MLALGWLLGGTVGVGTVAYALAIGPLAQFFIPLFTVPGHGPTTGVRPAAVAGADAAGPAPRRRPVSDGDSAGPACDRRTQLGDHPDALAVPSARRARHHSPHGG